MLLKNKNMLRKILKPLFLWWNYCDSLENDEDFMFGVIDYKSWNKRHEYLQNDREAIKQI